MAMLPSASCSAYVGESSWSTPLPATPVVPYCQRSAPFRSTMNTRLRVAVDDQVRPVVEPPGAHRRLQRWVVLAAVYAQTT